jgi:hemerythrin
LRALNRELEQRVQQRTIDLEHANRQLQLLSTQDDLTGLPNRRFAILSLNQLWFETQRYGGALSVLMLDADRFKEVNDRFGHAAGDALLRDLAKRLRDAVRRSDIVCRLGGDEFLVICPRSSRLGAADVARKILADKRPCRTGDGVECWDGALSIGIAEVRGSMTRLEDLLQAADQALYTAKRQGGAQVAGP